MILIGQYDSPFVRRVAVALKTYGLAYEHEPWSVWGHTEEIARYNPLRRVPTLVMDDGEVVTESSAILAVVDDIVGPEHATLARTGKAGRDLQRLSAFAAGLGDHKINTALCPGGKERMRRLLNVVESGRVDLGPLVTHEFALDDIVTAYDLFANQRDNVLKVAIKPH